MGVFSKAIVRKAIVRKNVKNVNLSAIKSQGINPNTVEGTLSTRVERKMLSGVVVTALLVGSSTFLPKVCLAQAQNQQPAKQSVTQANEPLLLRSIVEPERAGLGIRSEVTASDLAEAQAKYVIATGAPGLKYEAKAVQNPDRLVVDIYGNIPLAKGSGIKPADIALTDDSFFQAVRIGSHKEKTRLVFDLRSDISLDGTSHRVENKGGDLVLTLINNKTLAAKAAGAKDARAQLATENTPASDAKNIATATAASPTVDDLIAQSSVAAKPELAQKEAEKIAEIKSSENKTSENKLTGMVFARSENDSGLVRLSLNEQTAYELRRTAPSEYVLTLAGVVPNEKTTFPQLAPKGVAGIRSARASQSGSSTLVRMFVDPGIELSAQPQNNDILITAQSSSIAANPSVRAQLVPNAEVGDFPKKGEKKLEDKVKEKAQETAADAQDLKAKENPTGITSADGSKIYTGRLVSIDLADTDIDAALRIIAEISDLNIVASDDVTGKITLRLIDVPWDQALDLILKTNGLDQVREGNVIRIAPIEKLKQERLAILDAKKAKEQLEELSVNYVRVSYARAAELKEQVESVLSERGVVSVDERTNQLIIKDIGKGHQAATELLKKLDLRTPQVLLETQIVESSRNILRDLGFQWNFSYSQSPETGNATGMNFPNSVKFGSGQAGGLPAFNFPAAIESTAGTAIAAVLDSADGSKSLSAVITALEKEGKGKVISRPQVATVNNKEAEISSVETLRVKTPSSGTAISTGSGASSSSGAATAFEEIKVGIELKVTPQASPDYFVLLDVNTKSSTLGSTFVDGIPSTLDRTATSTVLIKSGQTFALGGVYRLNDSDTLGGVPFFKDIPFFGHFFRRTQTNKKDEELIFFITPHIVEGSFDPSLM